MALAHDDIWQKFDLFGEQKTVRSGWSLGEVTTVPDISDFLLELPLDSEEVGGLELSECDLPDPTGEKAVVLPLAAFEPESLRHDCMWSGLCPSEEHKATHLKVRRGVPARCQVQEVRPALPWVLDTPCPSDLESSMDTSDLEEALSDTEAAPQQAANPTFTDHCYSGPSLLLTPAQSSEDEDSSSLPPPSLPALCLPPSPRTAPFLRPALSHTARKGKDRQTTIRTRPPRSSPMPSPNRPSAAKFKFHMKFTSASKPRSLLRHPNRLAKSLATKRPVLAKTAAREETVPAVPGPPQAGSVRAIKRQSVERVEEKGRDVRDLHNSMERQRRVDLKNAFDNLKVQVPEIADSDRASKLMILDQAAEFCSALLRREASLGEQRDRERRRNSLMKKKLALLRTQSKTSLSKCTRKNFL